MAGVPCPQGVPNATNASSGPALGPEFPNSLLLAVTSSVTLALGLLGTAVSLPLLCCKAKPPSRACVLLRHLALLDALLLPVLPLHIHSLLHGDRWPFGDAACGVSVALSRLRGSLGAALLGCLAAEQALALRLPLASLRLRAWHCSLLASGLWLLALGATVPLVALSTGLRDGAACLGSLPEDPHAMLGSLPEGSGAQRGAQPTAPQPCLGSLPEGSAAQPSAPQAILGSLPEGSGAQRGAQPMAPHAILGSLPQGPPEGSGAQHRAPQASLGSLPEGPHAILGSFLEGSGAQLMAPQAILGSLPEGRRAHAMAPQASLGSLPEGSGAQPKAPQGSQGSLPAGSGAQPADPHTILQSLPKGSGAQLSAPYAILQSLPKGSGAQLSAPHAILQSLPEGSRAQPMAPHTILALLWGSAVPIALTALVLPMAACSTARSGRRAGRRKALGTITMALGICALCFLPHSLCQLLQLLLGAGLIHGEPFHSLVPHLLRVTWALGTFSCCLDPVLVLYHFQASHGRWRCPFHLRARSQRVFTVCDRHFGDPSWGCRPGQRCEEKIPFWRWNRLSHFRPHVASENC